MYMYVYGLQLKYKTINTSNQHCIVQTHPIFFSVRLLLAVFAHLMQVCFVCVLLIDYTNLVIINPRVELHPSYRGITTLISNLLNIFCQYLRQSQ